MDGVAIVKDESGRNGHSKRCQVADHPAEKRPKKEDPENRNQPCQDDRKPQGPEVAAEKFQRSVKNIEMEWSMVIGWVIGVVPGFGHLIAEPTVDSFVEMGGFQVQIGKPNNRCEQQDQRRK